MPKSAPPPPESPSNGSYRSPSGHSSSYHHQSKRNNLSDSRHSTTSSTTATTAHTSDHNSLLFHPSNFHFPSLKSNKGVPKKEEDEDGEDEVLEDGTMQYYNDNLESFNLLSVVTNPREPALWETIWNSELFGGEGELEEYDPDYSPYDPFAVIQGSAKKKKDGKEDDYYVEQQQQHYLNNLDLMDLHKFLGRTGPFTRRFVDRGNVKRIGDVSEDEEEEDSEDEEEDGEMGGNIQEVNLQEGNMQKEVEQGKEQKDSDKGKEEMSPTHEKANQMSNEQPTNKPDDTSSQPQKQQQQQEEAKKPLADENTNEKKQDKETPKESTPPPPPPPPPPQKPKKKEIKKKKSFPLLEQCEKTVPELFFHPYFDLTDPRTFESVIELLSISNNEENDTPQQLDGNAPPNINPHNNSSTTNNDETETPPTTPNNNQKQLSTLTQHLDSIEVSLLEQVRSKSESYFRETARFADLKTLVSQGCTEVSTLRSSLKDVKTFSVTDVEEIPKNSMQRNALNEMSVVLDLVDDVVSAKQSVGGLMAANDFMGAIEAIAGARKLLEGKGYTTDEQPHGYKLGKLHALSNIDAQLGAYEKLVVERLSTDLIKIFLDWDENMALSSTASAIYLSSDANHNTNKTLQQQVTELVRALTICNKLSYTNELYSKRLCEMVKVTVKTVVTECAADANYSNRTKSNTSTDTSSQTSKQKMGTMTQGVTGMSFDQFLNCLDMLFEQILTFLKSAVGVVKFLREEGIVLKEIHGDCTDATTTTKTDKSSSSSSSALTSASELAHKSISELLRVRKEAHSLVSFEEMKRLWDTCLAFTLQLEKCSGSKAYGLRSTLLSQAKAFVERKHEGNMSNLVSALDCEKWLQCDVSAERQAALTRLSSGRAALSSSKSSSRLSPTSTQQTANNNNNNTSKKQQHLNTISPAEIEGSKYKVVWSCLLLIEMLMSNVACAAHFQTLASNIVGKIAELLRIFNTRTTHLVLGAGAIHSSARLKSINAKHLALVTQCLGLIGGVLPHVRAALMVQLPSKQHTLLIDLDRIKREYQEHNEKVLSKFVSIIGGIVEHGLAPRIPKTDFDSRSLKLLTPNSISGEDEVIDVSKIVCCPFLDGIGTNTKKMHQVLSNLLPPDHLQDVFGRIYVYIDQKVPMLFIKANEEDAKNGKNSSGGFIMPKTDLGKIRMILEVRAMGEGLNRLNGVTALTWGMVGVLEKELGMMKKVVQPAQEMQEEEEQKEQEGNDSVGEDENENVSSIDESEANGTAGIQESNIPQQNDIDNNRENEIKLTNDGDIAAQTYQTDVDITKSPPSADKNDENGKISNDHGNVTKSALKSDDDECLEEAPASNNGAQEEE